jgi:hypothetical protein
MVEAYNGQAFSRVLVIVAIDRIVLMSSKQGCPNFQPRRFCRQPLKTQKD